MKNGSALLYVIFAILSCSLIISYIIIRTGNSQIAQLSYAKEIINIYDQNFQSDLESMKKAYTPPE